MTKLRNSSHKSHPLLPTLLVLAIAPSAASAAWPVFGRPLVTDPNAQIRPAITGDGAGGAIVTWQDARLARVNIFAQHVLASGELDPAWPVNGRALLTDAAALASAAGGQFSPLIVPDGAGGGIVAWLDLRSDFTEIDIFAQHVLASGAVDIAWPANGRAIVAVAGQQNAFAIVSDGSGGAIVAWKDDRPGTTVADIFAEHVLSWGVLDPRWPVNGLAVGAAAGPQDFPAIVSDGSGGAIVTWQDQRGDPTGVDIYAQHVLSSGVVDPAWPVNGRALCTAGGDQGRPTITTDGAHGAIVAWADSRIVGTSHVFAEHVLASGAVDPAWPINGTAVSGAADAESRQLAITDQLGGAIVTWQGVKNGHINMFAMRITATGVVDPAWPAGGRALSVVDTDKTHGAIASDARGGALVTWQDNDDIFAQHVRASGTIDPAFSEEGRVVCNLSSQQGAAELVTTGDGGAIATWVDNRGGVSNDIFALQVIASGTTDVCDPASSFLPEEVSDAVRLSRSGSSAVLTWTVAPGATSSDVLRGLVSALPVGGSSDDEDCLADQVAGATLTDANVLLPGEAFWYLVRGKNACGVGTYGFEERDGAPGPVRFSQVCP